MVGVTRPASSDTGKNKYLNIQSRFSWTFMDNTNLKLNFCLHLPDKQSNYKRSSQRTRVRMSEKRSAFPV